MKISLLKSFLLVGAILSFGLAKAQEISGTVSDENGPLPGASVVVKGTTNGTQTDFDGNFTLNNVESDAVLVVSYIGYSTNEVDVNERTVVNIILREDAQALDEVVIIGYGTTTVKDATGAVSAINSEDFNSGIIASPEQLIQGKTSGVQIAQASGEPGAGVQIRIRGANSIRSNNNPLFVVDGIPLSAESTTPGGGDVQNGENASKNPLNFINPADIESISILKDASATAIYGSRGANGVVIVTTKTGKSAQGGAWEFDQTLSIATPRENYDLFDGPTFLAQQAALRSQEIADDLNFGSNTDWQEVVLRTSASPVTNLSYSNNYGSGNVRATFGYGKQFGVVEKSSQERITGRVNINQRFLDDRLKFSMQASLSRVNDEAPPVSGASGASGNLLGAAYSANPTWPDDPAFFNPGNQLNPANYLANFQQKTNTDRFLINFSTGYDILVDRDSNDLTAKLTLGYDNSEAAARATFAPAINNLERVSGNGQSSYNTLEATSKLLEATMNWKKGWTNSNLDVILGFTYQDFRRQGINSQGWGSSSPYLDQMGEDLKETIRSAEGSISGSYQQFGYDPNGSFVNSLFPFDDTGVLSPDITKRYVSAWGDTFDNTDELQSFFARGNFTLHNKFLFTGTFRADGSSKFSPDNQYGYFPSGAFAWKVNEEDFIGDKISTLKLRLSAGITGNQDGLGYAQFVKRSRFGGPSINADGSINRPGLETVAVQNPDLKWEETLDYNIGFDFGINLDRFVASLDLYRKETTDLLFKQAAAAPAFDPFVFKNLNAKLINQGVELSLGYDIIANEKISFTGAFNISYNDNKVEGLEGTTADLSPIRGPGLSNAFAQRLGEGISIFSYYMATYAEDASGNPDFNPDEKDFVGQDAVPDVTSGLTFNLKADRWDANIFFAGQFGFSIYNNTSNAFLNRPTFLTSRNSDPRGIDLLTQEVSTLYLEKGDFVRLQNATVGYTVPLSEEGVLKNLRFSLTGQNLLLFTGYNGLDPEVNANTGDIGGSGIPSQGIDYTTFPRPLTVTLGINAKF